MRKYNLAIIIIAALLLETTGFLQYFLSRKAVTKEIVQKASFDMEQSERITKVKAEVEAAVRNTILEVEETLNNPDEYYGIATRMVNQNPMIVGAGIAFVPDYYADKGKEHLYSPYAYDELVGKKSSKKLIRTSLLSFDYTTREWFQQPLNTAQSLWTEPYMDQGGTHVVMCTYTAPVKDKHGRRIAVLFADVPLESLSTMANNMYSGIDRVGMLIMVLHLVGLIAVALIIWRATVTFRRWKE